MSTFGLIEYNDASPEVRAVYDDIMATRKVDRVNNFWKALASHPPTLRRTWETLKSVMAPGAQRCTRLPREVAIHCQAQADVICLGSVRPYVIVSER